MEEKRGSFFLDGGTGRNRKKVLSVFIIKWCPRWQRPAARLYSKEQGLLGARSQGNFTTCLQSSPNTPLPLATTAAQQLRNSLGLHCGTEPHSDVPSGPNLNGGGARFGYHFYDFISIPYCVSCLLGQI